MRLVDADKMLKDMEDGKAPLVGYVPKEWIENEPTVNPSDYKYLDVKQIRNCQQRWIEAKYTYQSEYYTGSYPNREREIVTTPFRVHSLFERFEQIVSGDFIDPKAIREWCLDIPWLCLSSEDGKSFTEDEYYIWLVHHVFEPWDKDTIKRCLTDRRS